MKHIYRKVCLLSYKKYDIINPLKFLLTLLKMPLFNLYLYIKIKVKI